MADYFTEEEAIPIAECEAGGPFRCSTCGGYVNPGFMFNHHNSEMKCNFCGQMNSISGTKYAYSPGDKSQTEMSCGIYEFDVAGRYVYHTMRQPTYIFLIDTSIESLSSGLFTSAISSLKSSLDSMPNPEGTNIGIVTVDN